MEPYRGKSNYCEIFESFGSEHPGFLVTSRGVKASRIEGIFWCNESSVHQVQESEPNSARNDNALEKENESENTEVH